MSLNKEQSAAVQAKESKVLVLAPAASGKTTVLTERVKYLLEQGVADKTIVAITFTNLAAYEMRKRLDMLDNNNIFIGTIHSYANRILMMNSIDTSEDINAENFDNLLEKAKKTIKRPLVEYLLVDEAQDLGDLEYDFIESLHAKNEYYVADDWQAIYGFKGSNVDIMFKWMRNPSFKVYKLSKNYRNGYKIVDFSLRLLNNVRKKSSKTVEPMNQYGGQIIECNHVKAIQQILDKKNYKDWFVLARTNKEIETLKGILTSYEIPYITFKRSELTLEEIENFLNQDVVKLLTIHTSKGLEAENVIVVGANLWNDDECRVAYVGATRAKTKLYWCPSCTPKGNFKNKGKPSKNNGMIDFSSPSFSIEEEVLGRPGFKTERGQRAMMGMIDDVINFEEDVTKPIW